MKAKCVVICKVMPKDWSLTVSRKGNRMAWTTAEVDRVIRQLEDTRTTEYFRSPDRPDGSFFHRRERRPAEVVRAQARLRTQHWRMRMDQKGAPTVAQIGAAMVAALINSRLADVTPGDRDLVGRTLANLQVRGFSVEEALATLKRLRARERKAGEPAQRSTRRAG